jgi:hypothetical protein
MHAVLLIPAPLAVEVVTSFSTKIIRNIDVAPRRLSTTCSS